MARKKAHPPASTQPEEKTVAEKIDTYEAPMVKSKKFPIVGLGASAGGLDALKSFFSAVPANSGMAYIVVVHMTPKQPSLMPDLLQKVTPIPVSAAQDGQIIEPDHIYVIPPDKEISVFQAKIQLLDLMEKPAVLPIDFFLRSLAQDHGAKAAAIILSGTGTDGTLGVKTIKANDGLVLVQTVESAAYDGMPRSAIATGVVDVILPPGEMPNKLLQYFKHSILAPDLTSCLDDAAFSVPDKQRNWLSKIFTVLRAQTGHDFSAYKANTILRRIDRRMGLNQIESREIYFSYLRKNPAEVEALFRELLIGVTNFFRDAESFEFLKTRVLPEIIEVMNDGATFRAWVPGCSTGEEVYSLAIILRECLETSQKQINFQLFGTDIDNYAVEKARDGLFPASITADVSKERLARHFVKEGDFYRIHKEIRDTVVFSAQDVIKDPPFSRLNLLCCRNLLIYLDTEAQKKLLPLFHYTLVPEGILVLGTSETIGGFGNLFTTLDKKWKIFKRREVPLAQRQMVDFPSGVSRQESVSVNLANIAAPQKTDIAIITHKAILDQFAPTTILIEPDGEVLHVHGRTGKYLETPSGPPTHNILDLAREGLRIELSSAIRAAKSSLTNITRKRVTVKTNGDMQMIDLHVCPQKSPKELAGRFFIVFEELDVAATAGGSQDGPQEKSLVELSKFTELERELQSTRESHQTTIEELESSNEELKSTNEELQSSNEELQSTNEELESSKEELQSLNEELQTVNAELQSKVEELSAAHDDMRNLLNSTEIATIFVDNDLRIRRFTPEATTIVNLIPTDIGRPLKHVVNNLLYQNVNRDLAEVLKKLTPREVEVQTNKEEWFKMRIMPYRTTDNRIDGAVLNFISIDDQKKAQTVLKNTVFEMEQAWKLVRTVFDVISDPMAVMDKDLRIIIANEAMSGLLAVPQGEIGKVNLFETQGRFSKKLDLKKRLKAAVLKGDDFKTEAFEYESPKGNQRFAISGRILEHINESSLFILIHLVPEA